MNFSPEELNLFRENALTEFEEATYKNMNFADVLKAVYVSGYELGFASSQGRKTDSRVINFRKTKRDL